MNIDDFGKLYKIIDLGIWNLKKFGSVTSITEKKIWRDLKSLGYTEGVDYTFFRDYQYNKDVVHTFLIIPIRTFEIQEVQHVLHDVL